VDTDLWWEGAYLGLLGWWCLLGWASNGLLGKLKEDRGPRGVAELKSLQ
jgi:hypothetical protein